MQIRKCDLCKDIIDGTDGVSFTVTGKGIFDFCDRCVNFVRTGICQNCRGKGTVRVRDDEATNAQSSCGESRTQYRNDVCPRCKKEK